MLDDFSKHQQGIIKRYYANADKISLQKLSELVSDLYLAEGKKREKVWKSIIAAMTKIGVAQERIDHIKERDDPILVANLVKELHGK